MDDYVKIDADREPKEGVTGQCISVIKRREYIDGIGDVWFIRSVECEQDAHAYLKAMFVRRTPPFTEQEITDWQEAWEIIKNIKSYDFDKIKDKYKMQILREEEPYECWGEYEEFGDEVMLQGWIGDIINEENWQVK